MSNHVNVFLRGSSIMLSKHSKQTKVTKNKKTEKCRLPLAIPSSYMSTCACVCAKSIQFKCIQMYPNVHFESFRPQTPNATVSHSQSMHMSWPSPRANKSDEEPAACSAAVFVPTVAVPTRILASHQTRVMCNMLRYSRARE